MPINKLHHQGGESGEEAKRSSSAPTSTLNSTLALILTSPHYQILSPGVVLRLQTKDFFYIGKMKTLRNDYTKMKILVFIFSMDAPYQFLLI